MDGRLELVQLQPFSIAAIRVAIAGHVQPAGNSPAGKDDDVVDEFWLALKDGFSQNGLARA